MPTIKSGYFGRVIQRLRDQRGITGLETAIVLIAFVVVSSVFAFAALSTGLFSSDKAKETIQAGLADAQDDVAAADLADELREFLAELEA